MTTSFKMNQFTIVKDARMSLIKTEPFYASLLLNLELVEDPSINTFGVNSKVLKYNPTFASKLSFSTMKVILRHEVMHLVLKHHLRGSKILNYNHKDFNAAADLALNCEIFHYDGFPDDALLPGRGSYVDFPFSKSAEFYYDLIQKKKQEEKDKKDQEKQEQEENSDTEDQEESTDETSDDQTEDGDSEDQPDDEESEDGDSNDDETDDETDEDDAGEDSSGVGGDDSDGDDSDEESDTGDDSSGVGDDEESEDGEEPETCTFGDFEECPEDEIDEETDKINQMTIQAASAAKEAGEGCPSFVKELIGDLTKKPKINWNILLRNYLTGRKRYGINWMVPSRRVRSDSFMMPSRQIKSPGDVLFVMDSSGSMKRPEFDITLTEGQSALNMLEKFELWQFDTQIRDVKEIDKSTDISKLEMIGRGGTDFQCVVNKLKTLKVKPKLMVVMTDLCFGSELDFAVGTYKPKSFKKQLQGIDVLWLCTSDKVSDTGRTININKI